MTGAADFESVALPVAAFTVEKLLGSQYRHTLPIFAFLAWGLLSAFVIA